MDIDPRYLLAVLLSEEFSAFADSVSGRSGIPKINREELRGYSLLLPSLPEQRRISEILDTVDDAIRSIERLHGKLAQSRRACAQHALGRFHISGSLAACLTGTPQNGLYEPLENYQPDGVAIVRIDDLSDGVIRSIEGLRRLRLEKNEIQRYGLQANDLIVNRVNSVGLVGKSSLVPQFGEPVVFESNIMRLRVNCNLAWPPFVALWLSGDVAKRHFRRRTKSAVAQASIDQRDVCECPIALPSMSEQRRIVAAIAALDQRISASEGELSKLQQLKQGLTDDLLSGRVRVPHILEEKPDGSRVGVPEG